MKIQWPAATVETDNKVLTNPALQKQIVHFSKRHVLPFGQHIYTNIKYSFKNATLEHMILFFDHDVIYVVH